MISQGHKIEASPTGTQACPIQLGVLVADEVSKWHSKQHGSNNCLLFVCNQPSAAAAGAAVGAAAAYSSTAQQHKHPASNSQTKIVGQRVHKTAYTCLKAARASCTQPDTELLVKKYARHGHTCSEGIKAPLGAAGPLVISIMHATAASTCSQLSLSQQHTALLQLQHKRPSCLHAST